MIEVLFVICMATMFGVGMIFNVSYMTANVVLFCFVEPAFTVTMVILAILALFRLPVNEVGKWIFRITVAGVGIVLLAGGLFALSMVMGWTAGADPPIIEPDTPLWIENIFDGTVEWMNRTAGLLRTSYEVVNLVLYILLMPALCIGSYVILIRSDQCKKPNKAEGDRKVTVADESATTESDIS